jgi:predicted Zn-dependent protease
MKLHSVKTAVCMLCVPVVLLLTCSAWAFEINKDGQALVSKASSAYASDLRNRPVVTDPVVLEYCKSIVKRLVPEDRQPPSGVCLSVTVIDSPRPELYAYVDGHLVMTTAVVYGMDNEAQLAGVMAHEVAQLVEAYYIQMYQEIKAAERRKRTAAAAGSLLGAMLDIAVDYTVGMENIRATERAYYGEDTYRETRENILALRSAQSAYYSIADVMKSIPSADDTGQWIDPRQRFEPVCDAQGMVYTARAGYDVSEVAKGWEKIQHINNALAKKRAQGLGALGDQAHAFEGLTEIRMQRLRQALGAEGLIQTLSDAPSSRVGFAEALVHMKEVRDAQPGSLRDKAEARYVAFVQKTLLPKANQALLNDDHDQALSLYRTLYDKGIITAPVAYGLAKGMLDDFAFAASNAQKKEAEGYFREAIRLDSNYVPAYRGLGELYEDWERYEDALEAYSAYLQKAPDAADHKRIQRKVKMLKRKAMR